MLISIYLNNGFFSTASKKFNSLALLALLTLIPLIIPLCVLAFFSFYNENCLC